MATLSGFFGLLAALLAVAGLYGVISYIVAMRRNEIGIRMALGASRRDVVAIIVRQTLVLLALGVAVGVVLALAAVRSASSLLFGLQPNDPLTFAAASALLRIKSKDTRAAEVLAKGMASADASTRRHAARAGRRDARWRRPARRDPTTRRHPRRLRRSGDPDGTCQSPRGGHEHSPKMI